ncbi:hypothetical protein [Streptomyces sp. NPDC056401]|uniref:hypothetical protein n=1 Tax=Streptomyces sp. NPDC056401 TaxID=3345809 RepID=UPI0035D89BAD
MTDRQKSMILPAEPTYGAYRFLGMADVGKASDGTEYAMFAKAFWPLARKHRFTALDYEVFGCLFSLQVSQVPGRVIYTSQRHLASELGSAQRSISVSMKKLRAASMVYPVEGVERGILHLNPQITYCGKGGTHEEAVAGVPQKFALVVEPAPLRAA